MYCILPGLHIRANYILLRNAVPVLNKQVYNISHPHSECDSEGAREVRAREMQETKATL